MVTINELEELDRNLPGLQTLQASERAHDRAADGIGGQTIPHSFSRKANKLHGEQFCRKLPLMRKVREVKSNLVGKLFETCDKDWKK